MSGAREGGLDMEVLKTLVDKDKGPGDPAAAEKGDKDRVEEHVGGEAWYGSMAIIQHHKRHKGSPLRQVLAAFFVNLGTVNTGMMFAFSAVTIPQLRHPDSFIKIGPEEASWIASLSSVTTPIGCILSGYLLDAIGRKRTIILCLLPMIIGWFLISAASGVYMIYAGRLFVGLGGGMMGSPANVYTGEVTQPHLRGMLAAVAAVMLALGVNLEYVVGSLLPWFWLSFINGVIPTVGLVSAFFLPESPSWLLNQGRVQEAKAALKSLRGPTCDVGDEFQDLLQSDKPKGANEEKQSFIQTILDPSAIKPFVILALFFVIYQTSGVSPVTAYAVDVIKDSGAQMDANIATIVLGVVRLSFTVLSCILLRRVGRRPLALISSTFCCLAMLALGLYMFMALKWKADGVEPVATWFPAIDIFFFMGACTTGLAVLPWVMIGELYPSKVRGIMGGLTTCVGHLMIFLVIKTYPLLQSISTYGTYLFYGGCSLLGTIYLYIYLPETKGRTLQEIEDYFSGKTKTLKPPKEKETSNNNKSQSGQGG